MEETVRSLNKIVFGKGGDYTKCIEGKASWIELFKITYMLITME